MSNESSTTINSREGWGESESPYEPGLMVSSLSAVDILYLGRIFPKHASIMAKKELKWVPGLGWFSKCCCCLLKFGLWCVQQLTLPSLSDALGLYLYQPRQQQVSRWHDAGCCPGDEA